MLLSQAAHSVSVNRRTAIVGTGLLALAAATSRLVGATDAIAHLTARMFHPHHGETFVAVGQQSGQRATLTLTAIDSLSTASFPIQLPSFVRRDPFSLIFESVVELPQEVYTLHHPKLGILTLLMTPVFTSNQASYAYEVVVG